MGFFWHFIEVVLLRGYCVLGILAEEDMFSCFVCLLLGVYAQLFPSRVRVLVKFLLFLARVNFLPSEKVLRRPEVKLL